MKKKQTCMVTVLILISALLLSACGDTDTAMTPGIDAAVYTSVTPGTVLNAASPGAQRNTIMVNSSEQLTVIPDIAQLVYAIRTEQSNAADCQKKNTEEVNLVIELLKSLGIEDSSIQTSDYYMSPLYSYTDNTQKLRGYEAVTTLTISDLPIDSLGDILTQSVNAGVNNIQSITYQSSQYDASYQEALKLAMASAKTKADALAQAGSCTLGSVVGVVETSNYSDARYTDNALSSRIRSADLKQLQSGGADEGVNIMPGEVKVEVSITVEYLIQ